MGDQNAVVHQDIFQQDLNDDSVLIRPVSISPLKKWQRVKLGEIFTQVAKKCRQVRIEDDSLYRLLTVKLYAQGVVLRAEEEGTSIGTKVLFQTNSGDFVFSKIDARNGAWGFVPEKLAGGLVSGDFPIWQLNHQQADQLFIEYALSRPIIWKPLRNIAVGTTNRKRVQPKQFTDIIILLPPLPEQHAIVKTLRAVQEAIQARFEELQLEHERRAALMEYLFTQGTHGEPRIQTEIGEIPENWQVAKLGDKCNIFTGTTPSTDRSEYYQGTIPFIKTSEIVNNRIIKAETHISEQARQDYNLKIYPPGTVFMAMYGQGKTRGQVALLDISATTTQNTAAIVPNEELEPEYLWQWLMGQYINLREAGSIGHISHLNLGYVKQYKVLLPPLSEQREIAAILQVSDDKVDALEQELVLLEELFRALLEELMTGELSTLPLIEEGGTHE